jgi:AGCS family alanine or glycine:cation symporter
VLPYHIIYIAFAFIGSVISLDVVWNTADALNALMAIPNIIAVLLLSNIIAKETKHYLTDDNLKLSDDTPIPSRADLRKKH